MQDGQDTDGDEGMLDVNDPPRFGLNPAETLKETALAFANVYTQQGPVNPKPGLPPDVFYCTLEGRTYVVKKFLKPWRREGNYTGPRMAIGESERAAREVDIMRALKARPVDHCPDLFVELQEVYVTNQLISVVMSAYDQDLREYCNQKAYVGLTSAELRTVAARTLHALSYLHETLHVAHRDVKHENIFLKRAGDVSTAVLADVGHARSLNTGEEASTLGSTLGTWRFNPPEMGVGKTGPHTRRVDIYQVGALLFTIMFGIGQQRLHNIMDVVSKRLFFTDPDAVAAWNTAAAADGVSGAARAACVRRMLADDPQDRGGAFENMQDHWVIGRV